MNIYLKFSTVSAFSKSAWRLLSNKMVDPTGRLILCSSMYVISSQIWSLMAETWGSLASEFSSRIKIVESRKIARKSCKLDYYRLHKIGTFLSATSHGVGLGNITRSDSTPKSCCVKKVSSLSLSRTDSRSKRQTYTSRNVTSWSRLQHDEVRSMSRIVYPFPFAYMLLLSVHPTRVLHFRWYHSRSTITVRCLPVLISGLPVLFYFFL